MRYGAEIFSVSCCSGEPQVGSEQIGGDSECFSVFLSTESSLESDGREERFKREG